MSGDDVPTLPTLGQVAEPYGGIPAIQSRSVGHDKLKRHADTHVSGLHKIKDGVYYGRGCLIDTDIVIISGGSRGPRTLHAYIVPRSIYP